MGHGKQLKPEIPIWLHVAFRKPVKPWLGIRSHVWVTMRRQVLPILDHSKMKNRYRIEPGKVGGNTIGKILHYTTFKSGWEQSKVSISGAFWRCCCWSTGKQGRHISAFPKRCGQKWCGFLLHEGFLAEPLKNTEESVLVRLVQLITLNISWWWLHCNIVDSRLRGLVSLWISSLQTLQCCLDRRLPSDHDLQK